MVKKIAVIGCGGLGGFVAEELAKLDIADLLLIDGDKFDESNKDRQIFCNNLTLGKPKAEMVQKYILSFSNKMVLNLNENITDKNYEVLFDCDLVIDCTDNIETRMLINDYCKKNKIAIIHGGVSGNVGQVFLNLPTDKFSIKDIYKDSKEEKTKTTVYAVASIASLEVALADKYLKGVIEDIQGKLFLIDLESLSIKTLVL